MLRFIFFYLFFFSTLMSAHAEPSPMADPMRPEILYLNEVTSKENKSTVERPKKLILQQTIVSEQRKLAVINGFSLVEGERLKGGYRIMKINDDSVVLKRKNKEFTLYLAGRTNIKELSR